jgi:hypothetical protein
VSDDIREEVEKRGITRLCHFTPSRNLLHIAAGKTGILATAKLGQEERSVLNSTDLERFDGHTGHICCSVEYPNAWYFDRARSGAVLFRDWVVLLIKPHYLWASGTLFSPRNAAAARGAYLREEIEGFRSMFADRVSGAYGKIRIRGETHLSCSPTDDQAEVLVPDLIQLSDIIAVAVKSEEQAAVERVRLRVCQIPTSLFEFMVIPSLFDKYALSSAIRSGCRL